MLSKIWLKSDQGRVIEDRTLELARLRYERVKVEREKNYMKLA
jgi:hypothetical protein